MPWLLAALLAILLHIGVTDMADAVPRYHTVRTGETLSAIAQRYKVPLTQLRQWNKLKGDRILVGQRLNIYASPNATHYTIRPKDTLSKIARRFDLDLGQLRRLNNLKSDRIHVGQTLRIKPETSLKHTVQVGDNLTEIAHRYNLSLNQLRQLNKLTNDRIKPGQILELQSAAHTKPQAPAQQASLKTITYTVRPGDNLTHIAQRFDLYLSQLRRLNNLKNDRIKPGQVLTVQHASTPQKTVQQQAPPKTTTYTVRSGDNLTHIAQRAGLNLADLRRLNNLKNDRIKPGQTLVVSNPTQVDENAVLEPSEYTVRSGDNLSTIAQRFDLSLGFLRQINALSSDHLQPGQKLRLKTPQADAGIHIVRSGETLSQIAQYYALELDELRRLNGIEGAKILTGQKLRLKSAPIATHIVERGDALWEIARAYNMSVDELKALNQLESNRIYPGQKLKLNPQKAQRLAVYTVKQGDNLSEIARLHQMSVATLKHLNELRGSVIHPGNRLKVKPLLAHQDPGRAKVEIDWKSLNLSVSGMRRIESGIGPYYATRPKAKRQKHLGYYEETYSSPLRTYRQARRLWDAFEQCVDRMDPLSDTLRGWHIVLDPGHGGMDPGAIVQTLDNKGNKLYIVEDEYVYDVALRAYVYFRRHGAQVTLTLLSPNHLVRYNSPGLTFVNEKNEVYNSYTLNRHNTSRQWPRGGRSGNLDNRVRIAHDALKSAPKGRRIFLSFHADIDAKAPQAPLVLYNASRNGRNPDQASRQFAHGLLSALGAGSRTRGQSLAVLRNNPADVKVLVELRNLAYVDHVWALRYEQLRRRDAEKVVKGVLEYARHQSMQVSR
jgi:LysM repeat protein